MYGVGLRISDRRIVKIELSQEHPTGSSDPNLVGTDDENWPGLRTLKECQYSFLSIYGNRAASVLAILTVVDAH